MEGFEAEDGAEIARRLRERGVSIDDLRRRVVAARPAFPAPKRRLAAFLAGTDPQAEFSMDVRLALLSAAGISWSLDFVELSSHERLDLLVSKKERESSGGTDADLGSVGP